MHMRSAIHTAFSPCLTLTPHAINGAKFSLNFVVHNPAKLGSLVRFCGCLNEEELDGN